MTVSHMLLERHASAKTLQGHRQCSLLIADGNPDFRQGLRALLQFYNNHSPMNCVVLGEAASGAQALHLAQNLHPSIVILNVELESSWSASLELLMQLQQLEKSPSTLLISDYQEPDYLFKGMQAGATGYITKDHIATELLTAINTIESGQVYLHTKMVNAFFYLFQSHSRRALEKCKLLKLSKREQEVLKLLSQGDSNEDIAKTLFISVATVKSHFTSIFEKLGVKSRTQAIIQALRLGLV